MSFQRAATVANKLIVDDKIPAYVKQIMSPRYGVICKVSNTQTLSFETFCFLKKRFLSLFKFCALSNLLFFHELLTGPQPTFLECTVIFL